MPHKPINQKGFAAIEAVLIVIILAIIGGTGYYVYQANNKSTDTQNAAQTNANSATPHKKSAKADATKDWTSYTSTAGKFSLKYPGTWVQPTNKDLCNPDTFDRTLYLGPNSASVLKCATEYFGQINVTSVAGNQPAESEFDAAAFKNIVDKNVTVSGVKGKRTSAVAKDQPGLVGGYAAGTTVVKYSFYTNSNTYVATYIQAPKGSDPSQDVLADFDLMVTKTLKFE